MNQQNKKRKLNNSSYPKEHKVDNHRNDENEEEQPFYYIYERKNLNTNLRLNSSKQRSYDDSGDAVKSALTPLENKNIKLFDMCLRFIAENLELCDSFVGFPSQIGHLLFKECVKTGKFDSNKTKSSTLNKCLNLFANAYPDCLFECLNLANQTETVLNTLKPLINICQIKCLDLSGTNLNRYLIENDVNLMDLLKSSSGSLEELSLSNNDLDDGFIKKFTLPQRIDLVDFNKLKRLNLSMNKRLRLEDNLFKYMVKFGGLNEIIVSRY